MYLDKSHIKRDTAVFGPQQYYIEGCRDLMFTTESDAWAAIKLANMVARDRIAELKDLVDKF